MKFLLLEKIIAIRPPVHLRNAFVVIGIPAEKYIGYDLLFFTPGE